MPSATAAAHRILARPMILHTDIPTRANIDRLLVNRDPASVSIRPTDPASSNAAPRTALRNLGEKALQQLRSAGIESTQVAAVEDELADLLDDQAFWRYQARTLAVLLTPELMQTFRLPNRLLGNLEVSDRFHLKPLLRAVTFPQVGVRARARPELGARDRGLGRRQAGRGRVPDLPSDAASAAGRSSLADRAPTRRIQGDEGQKLRLRQYRAPHRTGAAAAAERPRHAPDPRRHRAARQHLPLGRPLPAPGSRQHRRQPREHLGRRARRPRARDPRWPVRRGVAAGARSCSSSAGLRAEGWWTSATSRARLPTERWTRCWSRSTRSCPARRRGDRGGDTGRRAIRRPLRRRGRDRPPRLACRRHASWPCAARTSPARPGSRRSSALSDLSPQGQHARR